MGSCKLCAMKIYRRGAYSDSRIFYQIRKNGDNITTDVTGLTNLFMLARINNFFCHQMAFIRMSDLNS